MERGQRPGTPLQLGTLGCCLSRPRGLIPGDTLPPLPAAVSFHPSARPGAVGPLLGVASLPARDQRAGRAQGRKASSLLRVSRRGRGSCWLSCPWQGRVLAAGCPGGCPGAGPAPQKVTAQGGCGGWQPSALFGHWIRRVTIRWERPKSEAKDGRMQRTQSVDTKVPNPPRHTCFLGLSPLSAGAAPSLRELTRLPSQPPPPLPRPEPLHHP